MPMHVVAYNQSVDSAVLTNINGVPEQVIRVSGADIILPPDLTNVGAFVTFGNNITQGRLLSPVLRKTLNVDMSPLNQTLGSPNTGTVSMFFNQPLALQGRDIMNFQAAENAAGASVLGAAVWIFDKILPLPTGPISTLKLTGATNTVANIWTNITLTPSQNLAPGMYAVVGMRAESANCSAARLVFPGNVWRPGCPGCAGASTGADWANEWRWGKLGVWGTFQHDQPPTADFLTSSIDAAETVYIDVIGPVSGTGT